MTQVPLVPPSNLTCLHSILHLPGPCRAAAMLSYMDYIQQAFYASTNWNEDNSYANLNATARGNPPPSTSPVNLILTPSPSAPRLSHTPRPLPASLLPLLPQLRYLLHAFQPRRRRRLPLIPLLLSPPTQRAPQPLRPPQQCRPRIPPNSTPHRPRRWAILGNLARGHTSRQARYLHPPPPPGRSLYIPMVLTN